MNMAWMRGFMKEAAANGLNEEQAQQLWVLACQRQMLEAPDSAFARGFNAEMKRAGAPELLEKQALLPLLLAGLGGAGLAAGAGYLGNKLPKWMEGWHQSALRGKGYNISGGPINEQIAKLKAQGYNVGGGPEEAAHKAWAESQGYKAPPGVSDLAAQIAELKKQMGQGGQGMGQGMFGSPHPYGFGYGYPMPMSIYGPRPWGM